MAWLIWKANHKLAEQTVSLACNSALQPTHMLKGKEVSNDFMSILWLDDIPCLKYSSDWQMLYLYLEREKTVPTRPRVQGPVLAQFSLPVSRTGLFLWCWFYSAVSSESALCVHDVCVGTD